MNKGGYMKPLFIFGWLILGLIQFAAMISGFVETFGAFFGIPAAFIIGQIPVIGTVMGIIGAMRSWNWSLVQSLLLFLGAPLVLLLFGSLFTREI